MSGKDKKGSLLPDNTETLLKNYRPAFAATPIKEVIAEDAEEKEATLEDVADEEISALLRKTAYGDYIAQVPISEGRFATIGVQSTKKASAFDGERDRKDAIRTRRILSASLIVRIILCILAIAAIGIVASIIGTAILNDITIKEAVNVFLQGFLKG